MKMEPLGKLKVFIINGFPRAGKDTFVDMCREFLSSQGYRTHLISSVDEVKRAAKLLGWDGEKDSRGRKFLSDMKDLSTYAYDGPLKYMTLKILKRAQPERDHAFFFMIREPEEIARMIDTCLMFTNAVCKTVLIRRPGAEEIDHDNTGDKAVTQFRYDCTIYNDSTLDALRLKVPNVCEGKHIKMDIKDAMIAAPIHANSTLDHYQLRASATAIYPILGHPIVYPALGLAGEAGEVTEKVKKLMRDSDGNVTPDIKESICKELGDVLWYVAEVARCLDLKLSEVANKNIQKLDARVRAKTINGSGDNR